jgi:hypothetical protein
MPTIAHGLGVGHGSLYEDPEKGTVEYRASGFLLAAFSVRLADVTGVSCQRILTGPYHVGWGGSHAWLMKVHGQGSVLAEVPVGYGTTEVVRTWFQSRMGEQKPTPAAPPAASIEPAKAETPPPQQRSVTDELKKLAALYESKWLSKAEFSAAKAKLLDEAKKAARR